MVNQESTSPPNPASSPDRGQNFYELDQDNQQDKLVETPSINTVEWEASEFISSTKSPVWHIAFIGAGFLTAILLVVVMRDIFASIFIFIMFGLTYSVAVRQPRTLKYAVGDQGVTIGDKIHPYELFHSFSVVQEGALDSIQFNPLQRLSLPIVIYFAPDDSRAIFDTISHYLPHEQKELSSIDRFSRRIHF